MDLLKWIAFAVLTAIGVYAAVRGVGSWRWNSATRLLMARLEAARLDGDDTFFNAADIVHLPHPIRRYFKRALTDGQPIIRSVDFSQTGTFNLGVDTPRWMPFTARQRVITRRPGFVWDARIRMMPGVPVLVHDAYVAGEGLLRPSILGLYALTDVSGTGDIAKGELMRYFAEAVWYPTALLPGQGVVWHAVDDASAFATLSDGPISLTMLFRFGSDGMVHSIRADARGAFEGSAIVMMPWECRMSNYQTVQGMRVPLTGEVFWITPQGDRPYFRGTVMQLAYCLKP